MSLLDTLDPVLKPWAQQLYDLAKSAGDNPQVTSARRTYAQQQALYQAYLNGKSRYPAAVPGTSAHEYGLAFDMVLSGAGEQAGAGDVWRSWGGKYGGEEDPIHFEYPGFTPPAGATSAPTPASYTPSTALQMARQIADLFVGLIPGLGGIVSIGALANAILQITGTGSDAIRTLAWGLSHPEEFFGVIWDALRGILLSEI